VSFLRFLGPPLGAPGLPPEIAFLAAEGVDAALLRRAAALAEASGTDAATALLRAGLMDEEPYYRALARALDAAYLDGPIPLGMGARFPDSLSLGMAPLVLGASAPAVLAPRGRQIAELLAGRSPRGRMPAVTSPTRLRAALFAAIPEAIAGYAVDDLEAKAPDWAFGSRPLGPALALVALVACAGIVVFEALPPFLAMILVVAAQTLFLVMAIFRVGAVFVGVPTVPPPIASPLSDRDLPTYTVLVALYREARVVPRLVSALARLDYPAAKLDLKFVVEADDAGTIAALAEVPLPARFEVIAVPDGRPRTKPRALNVALPLARGELLVVYDAEDVPDPGQLRLAAEIFARAPARTACLQGRLVIDNAEDSWIARCFAIEYAGLFDVLNPALAQWRLPMPLGGTSMHVRTEVLRKLHGWDARNVTEDADLGMRLACAGYEVGDLPSATIEEAPNNLPAWLHQRVRWMKGFLQTTVTYGRRPAETCRQLGRLDALCAVTLLPGAVASALVYPIFLVWAGADFLLQEIPAAPEPWPNLPLAVAITLFLAGSAALVLPAALGCIRRGWWDLLWFVPGMLLYFALVSVAAWLAVIEFVRAPSRWNKTEHGLSRTSRSGLLRPRRPAA
jgi:cellulose synthase/poly-beta-1,6-N-acetylglucosamine synthase-like glycosyltransferase